jgi:hypothetical protein
VENFIVKPEKITHSLIIAVLQSYDVVLRQVRHYANIFDKRPQWEMVLIDDGSKPPIEIAFSEYERFNFQLHQSFDYRPWTQPCARNFGSYAACGSFFLFTDIDHFFTAENIDEAYLFAGDRCFWKRRHGVLSETGEIINDDKTLLEYGCAPEHLRSIGQHANTFGIRKKTFEQLGGYDSKFCGKYGGDDTDFSDRYGKLHYAGGCKRSDTLQTMMYVYPDPAADRRGVFHDLRKGGGRDEIKHH